MKKISFLFALLVLVGCVTSPRGSVSSSDGSVINSGEFVDEVGNIKLPIDRVDYRKDWSYLGSWLVPDEKSDGSGFHEVFTQPEAAGYFRKTGKFADGTVLIKEIRKFKRSDLTTGAGVYHSDTNKIWFVMVKDSKGKFKGDNWGEGWGWALFDNVTRLNKSKNFRSDCMGCHVPAKNSDWIYTYGYPTLLQTPFGKAGQ